MKRKFELVDDGLVVIPSFCDTPLEGDEDPLELSIQKWEAIVALYEEGCFDFFAGGTTSCALCQKFQRKGTYECEYCPVRLESGASLCSGTPYDDWMQDVSYPGQLVAAKAEVDYLKGLRDASRF